jgi:Icc-related predicted phosphoesterase
MNIVKSVQRSLFSLHLFNRRKFLILGGLAGFGLALQRTDRAIDSSLSTDSFPTKDNATPPLLRFVSVADTGHGNRGQYTVADAMNAYSRSHLFPFVLLAGDNIYNRGEIEKIGDVFEKPYQALLEQGIQFYAVLGNHDIRTKNGDDQLQYPGFNMQGRYYTFVRDGVQFFALDTNYNAQWKEQLEWLEKELDQSEASWKIVFGHHPVYSSGMHGSSKTLEKKLTPLFSRYGVQLYLCGHDHNYERSNPLNGTTYIVCGGGSVLRQVGRSSWTAFSASVLSFVAFEVYSDRIELSAIAGDGKVFDRAAIALE